MLKKMLALVLAALAARTGLAQPTHQLLHGDTSLTPIYSPANLNLLDTIWFKIQVHPPLPTADNHIGFSLDISSLQPGHRLTLLNNTITLTPARWRQALDENNRIDTFLLLAQPSFKDTSKNEEIARLFITSQPDNYVLIRIPHRAAAVDTGQLTLIPNPSRSIVTFTDDIKTPQRDTLPIAFKISGKFNPNFATLHYQLNTGNLPNRPKLTNSRLTITPQMWDTARDKGGILRDLLYIDSYHVIDTGTLASAEGSIKIQEDSQDSIRLYSTSADQYNWYKKSNFILVSFIKSISGTTAQNELLDIFVKVNLRNKTALDQGKKLWFSMLGADAGLLSDTTKNGLPLNEAILNVNYALTTIDDKTSRVGFLGGGFKQFFGKGFFGGHVGILEVNSFLRSSYIFAGYYYSPFEGKRQLADSSNVPIFYRHNIYIEAAFNAFGDNAPKALQYLRLKFGLMMPMAVNDPLLPTSKFFNYRLAIEVPIGGVIKF